MCRFLFLYLYSIDASLGKQAIYSSELGVNSQTYPRTCGRVNYYYEAVEINVIETGYYIILSNSTIDTYGVIYENNFDVFRTGMNFILEDDKSGCNDQFKILTLLAVNTTYILVVTTSKRNMTGTFSVIVFGPKNVSMNHIGEYG